MKYERKSVPCYKERRRMKVKMQWSVYKLHKPGCKHKTEGTAVQCVVSFLIALLLAYSILKFPEILSAKRRSWDDGWWNYKILILGTAKEMHVECWNSMAVYSETQFVYRISKFNLQCKFFLCLYILTRICQHCECIKNKGFW